MEFLGYFRAVRRHWVIVVLCVLVCAGLGVASSELDSTKPAKSRTYYKATHTLQFDPNAASDSVITSAARSLDQMAVLTTTGPVPAAVASKLGTSESGHELSQQITTFVNPSASTLQITAVDGDSERAVELADAFADALVEYLTDKDADTYDKARSDAQATVDELQTEINSLSARIAANPPDANVLRAQLDGLSDSYRSAVSELQTISGAEAPTGALATLESANADSIGQSEYNALLALGRSGKNNISATGSDTAPSVGGTSSSIDGTVPRGLLGGFLGLLLGVGIALLLDQFDRRIRTRDVAEAAFRLPVIAEVPKLDAKQSAFSVVSHDAPLSATAETYRALRSALLFQHSVGAAASSPGGDPLDVSVPFEAGDVPPMTVMIASASPKEGKSTTAANLAAVFAETGSTVLVVNCDFRRPMVHRYLGVQDTPRRVVATRIPGVKAVTNVLAESDANPARVLAEQRRLITAARGQFDVMILDTAPVLSANDAIDLVGGVDLVVLVAKPGQTTTTEAERTVEKLERVHAPVAGVMLIGTTESPNNYYYYGQYQADPIPELGTKSKGRGSRRRRRAEEAAAVVTNGAGSVADRSGGVGPSTRAPVIDGEGSA